jgi:glucuronoarabinoxylan endo-1,4-beta-xylanase
VLAWLIRDSRRRVAAAGLAFALLAAGCFSSGARPDRTDTPADPVQIDLTQHEQRMDGFGASSAWTANNISDAEADLLFSPTAANGIALSLLRVQIKPEGVTQEMGTARKAIARGAAVWAAPWSPPGAWKTTGTTQNGGSLLREHWQDWADRLAAFAQTMSTEAVPLVALSVQNEPGFVESWDTCEWEAAELVEFVRDYLGPALDARGLTTPIMAPETQNWTLFGSYAGAFANDPGAMQYLGFFAAHNYGGSPHTVDAVQATGKPVWQTEVSDSTPLDTGMGSALKYGEMIHQNLVAGRVSAWHYWWLRPRTDQSTNSALLEAGQLTRRAYVLGNWSRFVRPGAVRVAADATVQAYVYVTAFIDPASRQLAVVAINKASYELEQSFTIAGGTVDAVTPWLTSEGAALQAQPALPVVDGGFTVTLPARSVTTFVGTAAL